MKRHDVTVRIDTELRDKAREHGINMSRLLERAIADKIALIDNWISVQHDSS